MRQSFLREDPFGFKSTFVWFDNYTKLLQNSDYLRSLGTTAIFAIAVTALSMSLALLLAAAVSRVLKTNRLYTTLLVWPYAVAPAAVTVSSLLMPFLIQGTAAPGAAVSVETAAFGAFNGFNKNITAQGVTIDTSVAQTLQFTMTYGAGTAGNTVNLRQLVGEVIGF